MDHAILSRRIYLKAIESYSPFDEVSRGITISLMLDAIEMFLWHIGSVKNITFRDRDTFLAMLDKVDEEVSLVLKNQIIQLNRARVSFKHYGQNPDQTKSSVFIDDAGQFLEKNFSLVDIDFNSLSLASLITNSLIRECIVKSEEHIEIGMLEEALIQSSIAFQYLEGLAVNRTQIDDWAIDEVENAWQDLSEDYAEEFRDFTRNIASVLKQMLKFNSLSQLGFPLEKVREIKSMCFGVNISNEGGVLGSTNYCNAMPKKDAIQRINNFIIDACGRL